MQKNLKRTVATAAATAVLMFGSLTPAVFAEDITVSGNGQGSSNTANVSSPTTTTTTQSNTANIQNNVETHANTGDNSASGNTGGNVTVGTGAANSTVSVTNKANANVANPNPCCQTGNGTVEISGNGKDSFNKANVDASHTNSTSQTNSATIKNHVDSDVNTGYNSADGNTGGTTGGTVSITTGAASAHATIHNTANANIAGGGTGAGSTGGLLSAKILNNGQGSVNTIALAVPQSNTISQSNRADFSNHVDADVNSGYNSASGNTGGEASVTTGGATSSVDISNWANFNSADTDCGCLMDLNAKIAGNGLDTFNTITASAAKNTALSQGNGAGFWNSAEPELSTGDNTTDNNTVGGTRGDDPSVHTGAADSGVTVNNIANANVAGSHPAVTLPGGLSLSFGFDFSGLLGMMGM